uniref:Uncharacterized protein n=1 Tax=Arundo donax TaxID=35708 RepID=A0A0A8ZDS5_ARUDO
MRNNMLQPYKTCSLKFPRPYKKLSESHWLLGIKYSHIQSQNVAVT